MKLKAELVARLVSLEGVSHVDWPNRDDGFSTLHYRGLEIGHFHHFNELDLKLGKQLIKQEGLSHPSDSKHHPNRKPGSAYIELRFQRQSHLDKIVDLFTKLIETL